MRTRHQWPSCLVVAMSMGAALAAQTPKPTFEVASVKKLDQPLTFKGFPPRMSGGGTVRVPNGTVVSLMRVAYGVRDIQVVDGPDWARKDLFMVEGKTAGETAPEQVRLMLQSLLEDRFGLVTHHESRDMGFFAIALARSDGRPGPYLHRMPETPTCDRKAFEAVENARAKPTQGFVMASFCGPLASLAELASRHVELPVFDRTGLMGKWGATVYFAPDPILGPARLAVAPDPGLASFPVALQEQLGLKLEPTHAPIDVLVIDAVHQPTEN